MTSPADGLPRTEAVLERQRQAGLHPAACVVATLDAEPAGVAAVGEARPGVPMGPSSEVRWFSMTKVATALRVAMAWEAGALTLDDPVALHLPAFAAGGKGDVSVRHLLTHTGGFRRADQQPTLSGWDDELDRICAEPQEAGWRPGRHAGYSLRAGYFVLAEVVRRALADTRPWERIVVEDVFTPLGMAGSHLVTGAASLDLTAAYWTTPPAAAETQALDDDPDTAAVCVPGSSGRGPVEELPRLLEVVYHGGGSLLSPGTAEAVTARHRTGLHDRTFGAILDWGLGVIVDSKVHGRDLVPYGFGLAASPRTFATGAASRPASSATPRWASSPPSPPPACVATPPTASGPTRSSLPCTKISGRPDRSEEVRSSRWPGLRCPAQGWRGSNGCRGVRRARPRPAPPRPSASRPVPTRW